MASGKGSSDSDTATTTTTTSTQQTFNTVDSRAVEGDGARIGGNVALIGSSGNTVTTTDQGAVQAGLDLALESLGAVQNLTRSQQDSTRDTIGNAFALADKARQSETSNALQSSLKYAAIVIVVGLIAWAVSKAR